MRRNIARLSILTTAIALAAAIPGCSDSPTSVREPAGRPAAFSIDTFYNFGPYYVTAVQPDDEGMCYTLQEIPWGGSTNVYHCGTMILNAPTLSNGIGIDAYGAPWEEHMVTVYALLDEDLVTSSCGVWDDGDQAWCTVSMNSWNISGGSVLESIQWELNLPNGESGGTHSDPGPTVRSVWAFDPPPSGSDVSLTYTFTGMNALNRTISLSSYDVGDALAAGCTDDPQDPNNPPTDPGTFDTAQFRQYLQAHRADTIPRQKYGISDCVHHVANAICKALGKVPRSADPACSGTGNPWEWGTYLKNLGWRWIADGCGVGNPPGYTPYQGDVVQFDQYMEKGRMSGHVAGWDGHHWVSDFEQQDIQPNMHVVDDANNTGAAHRCYHIYTRRP